MTDLAVNTNIINPEIYFGKSYLSKQRFVSYFLQISLVKKYVSAGDILEIGLGNGITADLLRKKYNLTTVDINPDLSPDVVASVDDLQVFGDERFDAAICFEVLEHLPFNKFKKSLSELKRVSKNLVIISLPYWGYTAGFKIKLPFLGEHCLKFKITALKKHNFNGQHFWEIGKRNYPLRRVKKEINQAGLKIVSSFWDLENPYHYFFVLRK